jgi:SWI/SNF-related matrix-associated actin-dependent regulator of chromatin subfamily D
VIRALWTYIKFHRLIDTQNPVYINFNEPLEEAFGVKKLLMSDLQKRVQEMLVPADPIEITHKITFSEETGEPQVYDLSIEVPEVVPSHFTGWFERVPGSYCDEVKELNQRSRQIIERIHKHKRRLEVLRAFSQNPIEVMRTLLANQCRDLKLMSEADAIEEAQRGASYYRSNSNWVAEAVDRVFDEATAPQTK